MLLCRTVVGESGKVWTYYPENAVGQRGKFGIVYKGFGPNKEPIAIKIVRDLFGRTTEERARRREIRNSDFLVASHQRRPINNLLVPLDHAILSDDLFIVMPLARRSLSDAIRSGLSNDERLLAARHTINGMIELAELGILHRDIKPANILQVDEVWKLADFGMARLPAEASESQTFFGGGTAAYMAPEIWRNDPASAKTDLYSLGITLYQLYKRGILPSKATTFEHSILRIPLVFAPESFQSR